MCRRFQAHFIRACDPRTAEGARYVDGIARRAGGVAGFRTVLVVAPATVLQNWCDEAEKWSERAKMSYFYYHVKAEQPLKKRIATLREWARDGGVAVIGYEALLALVKGKEV